MYFFIFKLQDIEKRKQQNLTGKAPVNIDPVRVLFFMKKKLRCLDLFQKIDADSSDSLSRKEIVEALRVKLDLLSRPLLLRKSHGKYMKKDKNTFFRVSNKQLTKAFFAKNFYTFHTI